MGMWSQVTKQLFAIFQRSGCQAKRLKPQASNCDMSVARVKPSQARQARGSFRSVSPSSSPSHKGRLSKVEIQIRSDLYTGRASDVS